MSNQLFDLIKTKQDKAEKEEELKEEEVKHSRKNDVIKSPFFFKGLTEIYIASAREKIGLTFDMYDFNRDGKITKEDVSLLLSYSELSLLMID